MSLVQQPIVNMQFPALALARACSLASGTHHAHRATSELERLNTFSNDGHGLVSSEISLLTRAFTTKEGQSRSTLALPILSLLIASLHFL